MTYTINFNPILKLSNEQFEQLCYSNPSIKFERNAQGELIIMSPTGGETGRQNVEIAADLVFWNRQTKLGIVFDSSTCFRFPSGGERSPDVAWVSATRWNQLSEEQKRKFPPIAPDFVIELMSPTDKLSEAQDKMLFYLQAGVKLGWLINPGGASVEIYRFGQEKEILSRPRSLSGESILPGFSLELSALWFR